MENKEKTVSVVIGRFQVAELHLGHKDLIDAAESTSNNLLIMIGCREGEFTDKDPMSFEVRKNMILNDYPRALILPVYDTRSDEYWSKNVDDIIENCCKDFKVKLFGSRDSFIKYYSGKYDTVQFPHKELCTISGTKNREDIKNNPINSVDFRKGIIYANQVRFPVSYQVTDIAILNKDKTKILLGRKPEKDFFQFIGGFVDPTDENLEDAAKREVEEEVGGIKTDCYEYLMSARIDDTRYFGQRDKILTAFFAATYVSGKISASDDIEEVRWFDINEIDSVLAIYHKKMVPFLMEYIQESRWKL